MHPLFREARRHVFACVCMYASGVWGCMYVCEFQSITQILQQAKAITPRRRQSLLKDSVKRFRQALHEMLMENEGVWSLFVHAL